MKWKLAHRLLAKKLAHRFLANKENEGRVRLGTLRGSTVCTRDASRPSYWTGLYEGHVVREMRKLIYPGAICYDVGAHIGYMSLVQAKLVGPSGRVFAFEPDPDNVALIERNILRNGISNVDIFPLAVADTHGMIRFAMFDYSFVNHIAGDNEPADARVSRIVSVSLDEFVYVKGNPPPAFIKIDVEGAEDRVLFGARQLLQTAKPVIIAEIRRRLFPRIEEMMLSEGYKFEMLHGGISDWDKYGIADICFTPRISPHEQRDQGLVY